MKNKLYEEYHSKRTTQFKIIKDGDYTYQTVIGFINKYAKTARKIIDIGCGVGTVDFYLGSKGKKVLGIDISGNAIQKATESSFVMGLGSTVKFKVFNFPHKTPSGKFDLIICTELLEHLKNDKLAVDKIHGMATKGGLIICSSPSKNSFLYRLGLLENFDKRVGHLRRYQPNEFATMFKTSGFRVLKIHKTQGVLRDFLFTTFLGGQLLRVVKREPFSYVVTKIDNLLCSVLGESDIYIIAKKI